MTPRIGLNRFGQSTRVMEGNLVMVLAWYDNEMGFNCQMLRVLKLIGSNL
jgi:glyceraldehyde 3-phosphate dehydrogenase